MDFHSYAESFPLLVGDAYETFKADIAKNGILEPIRYRYVGEVKQGLDGRNRLRACEELVIDCPELLVEISDEDVPAFIDSLNVHRRHLTAAEQQEKRAERVKRVAEKRSQGQSYRAIAESENISESQARRDSDISGAPPGAPENEKPVSPPKTTGKDGKKYPAKKPAKTPKPETIEEEPWPDEEPKKPKKGGKVLYNFKSFETCYGALLREIDTFGNCYKCKDSARATALRKQLSEFRVAFTNWHQELTK